MPVQITVQPTKRSLAARVLLRLGRAAAEIMWRGRMAHFGHRSIIERPALVSGHGSIRIGDHVHIWGFSRLQAFNVSDGADRISIGNGTVIQPHAHIAAADSIEIGAQVLMASHVYITDHDHDFSDPGAPVVSNRKLVVDPVRIGDRAWLGERAMVLKGVSIGESSIVGAGAIVTKDVPPFSIAVGSPARVISQYDHENRTWVKL